ncbi:regulator of protease activity HflC (stomatin/prohibitin superfamily) [Pontibacter mucosus]|uniref:Regulator of protease activity HflC (Stomatin/prohibitin superfamily) n=1 Tax=Pontibacter mucosus TaxID=1649266 RepID=A0A2T5YSB2_9BACT|nr:SPFH domain-containing protein [Pontibacter mucosus]PTX22209.1 regulator of protease activity HflC (stomatin/prohibitin superfamily) [Pontibacter mucosus]
MNRKITTWSIAVLLIVLFSVTAMTSCTRIDAGHEGILVKLYGTDKGVQDVNLVTGRVWYNPFTEEVFQFPTFVQTVDYPAFTVNAKDGSVFTVDPTISFRVSPGESPRIFSKYRKDIELITKTTLFNYTRDAFRIQFNQYTTDSIISNRQSFEDKVQVALDNALRKEGFELEQMTSGLQYPEVIVQAVNLKNKAVQQAMQVENELKVAEAQARKKIVEAEAEARANELRQRTLTPLLIQQQFIEKWDGKTPLYGNSPTFFKNVQ